MKCSKSSVASNTDRNVRPSFSGAIGGHSSPENSTPIASALSLCIQASKYMYTMFRYRSLSLYHQITTAATTHVCSRLHVLVQPTHAHAYIPDSLLQILYTVTQSYIHDQDAQDCELYCCTSTKRRCTCMKVYTCMPQQTHNLHSTSPVLQTSRPHHNLCTVRVADSAIKPYIYTTTFNNCMIKTFLFSYTVCRGHKLTNSTRRHTQTHTTQRHDYHKFQEQHTSANHSATGTSSDNVTNTYFESRTKAQAHLPCHPS